MIVDKIVCMFGYWVWVGLLLGKGLCFVIEVLLVCYVLCSCVELLVSVDDLCECLCGLWVWVLDNDVVICVGMCMLFEVWGCWVVMVLLEEDLV